MTYKLAPSRVEFERGYKAFRLGAQWKCSQIGRVLQHKRKFDNTASSVCCFLARGLTVTKHGRAVTPLFLSAADLEAAWAEMKASATAEGRALPEKPYVEIHDMLVLLGEHEGHDAEFSNWGFVPQSISVRAVELARTNGIKKARLFTRVR